MTVVAHLIGGSLDGAELPRRTWPPWAWVDARGHFHRKPRKGADLYRLMGGSPGVRRYVHAQWSHAVCDGCGVLHRREVDACTLCGERLATA